MSEETFDQLVRGVFGLFSLVDGELLFDASDEPTVMRTSLSYANYTPVEAPVCHIAGTDATCTLRKTYVHVTHLS